MILGNAARAIAWTGALMAAGCASTGATPHQAPGSGTEASLLTRYALSQCLARAYPHTAMERDARAAAGGYLEFGNLPIEAYEDATALAAEAAARTYTGKHGEPLHAMKCLDLLADPELDRLLELHAR